MEPKWIPKSSKSEKKLKMWEPEKHVKTNGKQICKSMNMMQKGTQKNYASIHLFYEKSWTFQKFTKIAPLGVPGSKRLAKGIQKKSKRHPKGVHKAWKWRPKGVLKAFEFDQHLNKQFDRQFERQFNRQATRQFNRQFNSKLFGKRARWRALRAAPWIYISIRKIQNFRFS